MCGSLTRLKVSGKHVKSLSEFAEAPCCLFKSELSNTEKIQLQSKKHDHQETLSYTFLFPLLSCISLTIYSENADIEGKGKIGKLIVLFFSVLSYSSVN